MFTRALILTFFIPYRVLAMNIVTTLPELAWVAKKLAPKAQVKSLLNGNEDPHFVDASPAFIFKSAKADMVIMNGMQLEVGWLPKVLQMSGNRKIQDLNTGLCDASKQVTKMGELQKYDRSMGDVHPQGNPHYTLSAERMKDVAQSIATCLKKQIKDESIDTHLGQLIQELDSISKKIKSKLKIKKVFVYHREFHYFAQDYGLDILQSLEEIPGVLPSASYLTQLALKAKSNKPQLVLAAVTNPVKILMKFEELSSIQYKMLRLHPRENEDYGLFLFEMVDIIQND